ncbi:MAG TPA: extensin family protein [Sphingomicrobium sp.]|nr:extensin family protein [Sphingomicrobium sp.]
MARLIRTAIVWLIVLGLSMILYLAARDHLRRHPQDVPWTQLSLADPQGIFTLRKLVGLRDDTARCRALIEAAGLDDGPAPPRRSGPDCGYADGMRLQRDVDFAPAGLVTACPVAAALHLLERDVLHAAAMRHFGQPVRTIDHAGSYTCRRLYARADGPFSEHATANALDILGLRLADGTSVSVLRDWSDPGPKGRLLREVRDGACGLFATVLSPDYNEAHRDHLHFDMASRGRSGFSVCR